MADEMAGQVNLQVDDGSSTSSSMSVPSSLNTINVEGSRAELTKQLFMTAIDKCVSSLTWSSYRTHYKEVHEVDRKNLKGLYAQFGEDLKTRISEEVNESVLDETFMNNLTHLDKIIEDWRTNHVRTADVKAWRPSRCPEKDLKPHRVALKLKEKTRLEEFLKKLQGETAVLRQSNRDINRKVCEYEQQILAKTTKLNKAVEACAKFPHTDVLLLNDE